jgi:hypothetical protein
MERAQAVGAARNQFALPHVPVVAVPLPFPCFWKSRRLVADATTDVVCITRLYVMVHPDKDLWLKVSQHFKGSRKKVQIVVS